MHRGGALVRWVGMIAILLSLFAPFATADVGAQEVPPDPEVTLVEEGTPAPPEAAAEPTPDPTLAPEPTTEPTPPPTAEPTSEPTPEPTAEPTIEPTVAPEPTSEPTAMPASQSRGAVTSASQPNPRANLAITFIPGSPLVIAGTPVDVIVRVSTTTSNVDIFSLQLFMPAAPGTSWTATPTNGECDSDFFCWPLEPSEAFEVHLTSPTTAATCGTHGFQVDAYGSQGLAQASNSFTVQCQPQLNVAVQAPNTVLPGDFVQSTFTITNTGSASANGVTVSGILPATGRSWTYFGGMSSIPCDTAALPGGGTSVTCTAGSIPAGGSAQASFFTTIGTAQALCGTTVQATAALGGNATGSATASTTINCPTAEFSLVGPATVALGDTATYTITVTNTGDVTTRAGVRMALPPLAKEGWTIDSVAGWVRDECIFTENGYLACSEVPVQVGSSATVTISGTVDIPSSCGPLEPVRAQLTGPTTTWTDPVETTILCPEVGISVSGPESVVPGDTLAYDIKVTSTGSAAPNVTFTSSLPTTGQAWSIVTPRDGTCALKDGTTLTCTIPGIAEDAPFTVRVQSTIPAVSPNCGAMTASAQLTEGYTGDDSVTTTVVCQPNVSITMSGPATATFGDALVQTLTVTNSGTAPASNVFVSMPLPVPLQQISWGPSASCNGNFPAGPATCTIPSLGSNQSAIFTAIFRPTASTCGPFAFQATFSGGATGTSNTVTTTVLCPDITIAVSGPTSITPGQDLAYDITVTNTGPMQATSVHFVGNLPATGRAWSIVSQTPGAICGIDARARSLTCGNITLPAQTGSFTVRVESATLAESRYCDGFTVPAWTTWPLRKDASATTTVSCTPDLAIAMSGTDATTPGGPIAYTIDVTNTGIGRAGDVGLESQLPEIGAPWALAPAAPAGCAIDGTLLRCTGLEVSPDDGHVAIAVNGTLGTDAGQCAGLSTSARLTGAYTGDSTTVATRVDCSPSLALTKTVASINGGPRSVPPGGEVTGLQPGDRVAYRLTAINNGNVTLTNVALTDDSAPFDACDPAVPPSSLAPGAGFTCTATVTITEAHVLAGFLTTAATVISSQTAPVPASVTVRIAAPAPALALTKTAIAVNDEPVEGEVSGLVLNDTVTYALVATNTGNLTVREVTITDQASGVTLGDCAPDTLVPGQTLRCEATYTIAQDDVDRANFTNTAGVTGVAVNDVPVSATASATVRTAQNPSLTLDAEGTYAEAGQSLGTVAYTFTVVNDGTTTLTGVTLGEAPGGLGLALACAIGDTPAEQPATLAPGASLACAASHTVTQPEMDGGSLVTTAQTDSDQTAAASAPAAVSLPRTPAITIASRAANIPANGYDRFDVVHYAYEVENTGNVTLQDVTVTDTVRSIHIDCGIPGVDLKDIVPTLAPGETATCDGTYMVVQEDVEAGSFANTARVTANAPRGTDPAIVSASANGSVPTDNTPGLTLQNNAYEGSRLLPGQTVTFAMIATNGGKVALTGVEITSSMPELSGLTCDMSGTPATQPVTLQRGEMVRCTATYTVTQDDFDRGSIANEASVSGTYGEITVDDAATATLDDRGTRDPRVELTTTASQLVGVTAGTDITLTYQVRNTGNVTLRNLTVTEDTPGMSTIDCGDGGNVIATLAPNTPAVTCTTTLTITQAMIDGYAPRDSGDFGWILTTTARVTADAPAGMTPAQVSGEGSVSIFGLRLVVVDLVTTVTHVDGAPVAAGEPVTGLTAGQVVTFALTATNTGHVTLNDVRITDTALGALVCPGSGSATLAPGEAVRCTGTLEITQGLFDTDPDRRAETRGRVTAQDPQGNAASDIHGVVVPLAPVAPVLDLAASVAPDTVDAPGDVTVTLTIANDGNVTLGNVVVPEHPVLDVARLDCDPNTEGAQAMIGTLPVGADVTCTVPFGIGQEQIDAGADITITVRAAADPAAFARVFSDEASATVGIDQKPDVAITNTVVGETTDLELGTTVTHAIAVTNTGNVTLGGVTVSDDAVSDDCLGWSTLAPGETVTCSVTGVITEADILAGELTTTAVVTATAPDGTELRREGAATVTTVAPAPALSIAKGAASADGMLGPDATVRLGDAFVYTFLVKNTGNVTITDVVVEDAMLSGAGVAIPAIGDLAPGESRTVEAPWTVGAADVEAGSIVNEAVATGKDPSGEGVTSAPGSSILTVAQHQGLEVTTEISTPEGGIREGTVLGLTITVTNTGDVTIRGIELTSDLAGLTWDEAARRGILAFAQIGAGRTVGDLAPGEAATVTATYRVTADDVAAGVIRGSVIAAGIGPGGGITTEPIEITLAVDPAAPEPGSSPTATPPVAPTDPEATTPVTPVDPAAITPEATSTPPAPLVVTGLPSTGASGGASGSLAPWLLVAAGALASGASALGMRRRAGR